MKIEIHQTISNKLSEKRELLSQSTSESYVLYPDVSKKIKNIKTNKVYPGFVYLSTRDKLTDFIEIDA